MSQQLNENLKLRYAAEKRASDAAAELEALKAEHAMTVNASRGDMKAAADQKMCPNGHAMGRLRSKPEIYAQYQCVRCSKCKK